MPKKSRRGDAASSSKTRKTTPALVRAFDKSDPAVTYEEVHRHQHGECDLPPAGSKEAILQALNPPYKNHCYFLVKQAAFDTPVGGAPIMGCSCSLCKGPRYGKRDRKEAEKEIAEQLQDVEV